ncbi:Hypothetical protein SRAE_2000521200 [Strongyloides ratti]|uniref:Uncharacterized protein n=1 Tax=Strongyloides ratti TaxID=34506 RepID=A0A090LLJ1_STRRB|nr:Hypothetical protein SRAE_2000521200 [Strongyloides ratti]CEF70585.1 Hypothetical protein SRAE_2000521200 [Strongyloides ratti]
MFNIIFRQNNNLKFFYKTNISSLRKLTIPIEMSEVQSVKVPYEMVKEDEELVHLGYFRKTKIDEIKLSNQQEWNPEIIFSKIQNDVEKNLKITGSDFMSNFLLPLENDFIISLCGKKMSDVSSKNRNIIMDRLWKAFESHDFKFTISSINSRLTVWEENDKSFDVKKTLEDLEKNFKISPNDEFMKHMMYQLARSGMKNDLKSFKIELLKRGFKLQKEYELAMIRCIFFKKMEVDCDNFIRILRDKYDNKDEIEALSQALLGTSQQLNLPRLNLLLMKTMDEKKKKGKKVLKLNLNQNVIMDIIWNLAIMTTSSNETSIVETSNKILSYASKNEGFRKLSLRECQRHISNKYYHTGIALLFNALNIENGSKDKSIINTINWMFKYMIKNRVENSRIRQIADNLSTSVHFNYRIFDDLAFSILTLKDYKSSERLKMLLYFINKIDPNRERDHLIFPILIDENNVINRLPLLYKWQRAGYCNLGKLNIYLLNIYILNPLFEWLVKKYPHESNYQHLERIVEIFKDFNISKVVLWNWLLNFKINFSKLNQSKLISIENLNEWLKVNFFKTLDVITEESMIENVYNSRNILEKDIKNNKFRNIHKFIENPNKFQLIEMNKYIDQILDLYLKYGDWKQIMTFLENISTYYTPISEEKEILTSNQILQILQKYSLLMPKMDEILKVVFKIKELFPNIKFKKEDYSNTQEQAMMFITNLFSIDNKQNISKKHIDDIQSLIVNLYEWNIIDLPTNEVLTSHFIKKVLTYSSYNVAVKSWLQFQNKLSCSNALLVLLNHAFKFDDDSFHIHYALLKARNFMAQSRINAFYIASLVYDNRLKKANKMIKTLDKSIKTSDIFHLFRLIYSFPNTPRKTFWLIVFMDICLLHTNLRNDKDVINLLINEILYNYENVKFYIKLQKFIKIFIDDGYILSEKQKKIINYIESNDKSLIHKWIISPETGILNINNSTKMMLVKKIDNCE